ncbi:MULTISPECIES: carbohydrate kinase [Cytobacillus]|uniref:Winged helix-turn-helix transcriptional regulator n=1 Tax=Cytobacillus stercorigallinarum TaxID=2762240 RepID=A0ABR8QSM4_9BACI|nr:carbohydrate kinase [Cytobacillus stercorigallinarum]MBD7938546.1 winged helix-turn-helix transcriptional regulator [Cytobacillus stercorigallinarum]
MNEKEQQILDFIKENPYISQSELAESLNISRSTVAGYISSLSKNGYISGRAYILPKQDPILCVGAANIDRKLHADDRLDEGTSNPVKTEQTGGGVARNIAENLARLEMSVSLLAAIGEDHEGMWLLDRLKPLVDTTPSIIIPTCRTGTYTAVLDKEGEMKIALSDMGINDILDVEIIESRWRYFTSASMVVLDTNFPNVILTRVIEKCKQFNTPLSITTVSTSKIKRLPDQLLGVSFLIANKDEASLLSGVKLTSEGDYFKACEMILAKGVQRVVITRGENGLVFATQDGEAGAIMPPYVHVVDVTGAGDALAAGIIYAHQKGMHIEDACKIGMICASVTLTSKETVHPQLNPKRLQQAFKEYF